ncbi:MAG: hypothetical protein GY790_19580 [Bacteroidetes bacterium]|nr:hypothetical protein [Bacteroidota bacterium]
MRLNKFLPGYLICALIFILMFSCEKENPDNAHPVSIDELTGYIQKGPYLNGTSLTVAELNQEMVQTGKNFNTQITDNRGSFELKQMELSSQFVELKADGFYYNEVADETSSARLVLYALSNLTDKSTLNVNLISHLEKDRVYQLLDEGFSFTEAKVQAQEDILGVFSIEKSDMAESELLDISQPGDEHAILLAISLVLQGYHTVGELSELLANINSDLKEDGELNSGSTGSILVNQAMLLDRELIRQNLESRYEETGMEVDLPDFEKYLDVFLENTEFEYTSLIEYPEFSDYGENLLYAEKSTFHSNVFYSMAADLPAGYSLTIKMSGGEWSYRVMPDGPVNWRISKYNSDTQSQTFTVKESGTYSDLSIRFEYYADSASTGQEKEILIEYFENLSDTATRKKIVTVEP